MKTPSILAACILLSCFINSAQAQDTTKKTTVISADTTVIRKDASTENKKQAADTSQVKVAPAPQAVAPVATPPQEEPVAFNQVGFHFGLRFQPGFTSIRSGAYKEGAVGVSGTVGYGYGLSLAYYFNNHFGTQLELMYSELGQKYTDQYNKSHEINLTYINIPLILTLNTDYGKPVNFNIAFGPQLGILAGSKITGNDGNFDAILSAKGMDLGVGFGGGLDFALGKKHHTHINVGFRGVRGIIDIDNSNGGSVTTNQYYALQRSHTNTSSLYLGFMFKL